MFLTVCINDGSVEIAKRVHLIPGLCPCGHDLHGRVPAHRT